MGIFDSGNVFSVMDSYGMNTLAFQVNESVEDGQVVNTLEKLKSYMEEVEGGYKKTFFFNPDPIKDERKELVFLTLKPNEAILNGGEFLNGKLNVGKKPGIIHYSAIKTSNEADLVREFKYLPNFKRPICIVDPEIGDEIRPVVFFDTDSRNVMARIKLQPNKSYIALEVV